MNKQEFIIAQLKPYFLDPNTCGFNTDIRVCVYLTQNGQVCVFGKNLTPSSLEEFKDSRDDANMLIEMYGEEILKEESRGILTPYEWKVMQQIHDGISIISMNKNVSHSDDFLGKIDFLSSETCDLSELKELAIKLVNDIQK